MILHSTWMRICGLWLLHPALFLIMYSLLYDTPVMCKDPGAFEIDRADSCYVPPPLRERYYQGCFWGGQSFAFSQMIRSLAQKVDEDLSLGNISIWHDQSYLNKYYLRSLIFIICQLLKHSRTHLDKFEQYITCIGRQIIGHPI